MNKSRCSSVMNVEWSSVCEAQVESVSSRGDGDDFSCAMSFGEGNGQSCPIEGASIDPEPWLNLSQQKSGEHEYDPMPSEQFWYAVKAGYEVNLRRAAESKDNGDTESAEENSTSNESSPDEQPATPHYSLCGVSRQRSGKRDGLLVPTPLLRNGLFEQWIFGPCQNPMDRW